MITAKTSNIDPVVNILVRAFGADPVASPAVRRRSVMTIEEYLLFALAVVYLLISNGNPPREHRATRWNNQDNQSSINPGPWKRDVPGR